MKWPFRRKALTGTPDVLETLAARQLRPWPGLGGTNLNTQRIRAAFSVAQDASYAWMYGNSPAVRTVVDLIARNAAQLDLRLYEEVTEAEREARPDHRAALSLRMPSPQMTRDQFVRAVFQDFLCFNNAYALKFRNRAAGRLILKPIPAQRVEILGESLFDPEAYKVYRRDGSFVIVEDPTDMVHWRGWNPEDPRLGLSPLETLRSVIAEDAALQATIVELAKSGLAGPAWVYRPLDAPEWENEDRARFEEDLQNRLRQAYKRPPVMEEGMELRNDGMSPRDAQMLEIRQWALRQVCAVYGVHPASVGLEGDIEEAQKVLYSDVLPPYCEAFTRQLDLSVLVGEYGETEFCFEFNLDEKHMGDDRLKALTSATGRPVMLTNEARARLNLPPVKGGDDLVTPDNVTAGDKPKPSVDIMPIQDPNKPPQDGSHREEEPKALATAGQGMILSRGQQAELAKQLEVTTQPRRMADIDRQLRYIDEAKAVFERHYARQARILGKSATKGADSERWNSELAGDIERLARSIVEREGGIYVSRLGGVDFDMRKVENYLHETAVGTAEGVNEATQRDIDEFGSEAAFDRARSVRIETAASSIGARSTMFARMEAARQSPFPERRTKSWVAHTKRHAEFDGVTVGLGEDWPSGFAPGSPPNCRCTMLVQ
jgi:HK97 family phage portal protein